MRPLAIAHGADAAAVVLSAYINRLVDRAPRVATITGRGDLSARRIGSAFGLRAGAGVIADSGGSTSLNLLVVARQVDGETLVTTLTAVEMP